jgi:hypothetical protein
MAFACRKNFLSRDRFDLLYNGSSIFFFGYILYGDEGDGARRYTVVCRRWNPLQTTLGAFARVENEDHENAD